MVQQDFYSGQVVNQPMSSEQEATSMASFGKYDYEPGARAMNYRNSMMINPGGYGFSTNMQPPLTGVGTPYRYSPAGNIMPTYQMYGASNPVFQNQYYQQLYQQQPMQQQQATYQIQGVGQGGEYLAPFDIDEKIEELKHKYWNKYQEQQAKVNVDRKAAGYGSWGNNYYGVPYFNPYQYNSLNQEIAKEVDEIKSKARQNRLDFEFNLSKMAHKFAGHIITDEDKLRERYEGKVVEIPKAIVDTTNLRDLQDQLRLDKMVPFDNSQFYRDQWAKVSEQFHSVISEDADMNETFSKMGIIAADWEMEDEMHRRRNVSTMYNSEDNGYKYYVRRMAEERYAKEKGLTIPPVGAPSSPMAQQQTLLNQFPTLSNSVTLAPDGTLNVTCNVGSHAGQQYSVNDNEAKYQERKERFDRFLSSVSGSIYKNYSSG